MQAPFRRIDVRQGSDAMKGNQEDAELLAHRSYQVLLQGLSVPYPVDRLDDELFREEGLRAEFAGWGDMARLWRLVHRLTMARWSRPSDLWLSRTEGDRFVDSKGGAESDGVGYRDDGIGVIKEERG